MPKTRKTAKPKKEKKNERDALFSEGDISSLYARLRGDGRAVGIVH